MDSMDAQRPEDKYENLAGTEAVKKIREQLGDAPICFFCTASAANDLASTRPMGVIEVDDAGALWFMSASDSHKNADIAADPNVRLYFHGSARADFLVLEGHATISRDRDRIEQLWSAPMKTYFTEGKDDPRITVLKVTPTDGYYWDTKHGIAVAAIKMAVGAVTGKTIDDAVEGTIVPS